MCPGREWNAKARGHGLTFQYHLLMLFDPYLGNTGLWEERTTRSPNMPADAILNAEKCQSWNNHNAIVLSLFTEISVIALHSNSIFKVHCARKKCCSSLILTFSSKPGGRWEVFELYENPHETLQLHFRALFRHPAHSLFPWLREKSHLQGLPSFWQQTLKEHQQK